MASKWFPGDTARCECYFYVASALTDPTTITFKIENPAGTITTYTYAGATITKNATGDYYIDVNLATEGTYHWRWVGTGAVAAADEGELTVIRSVFV